LIFGPSFLAIALAVALNTCLFLRRSGGASASIARMVSTRHDEEGSVAFAPVFVFTTADGRAYTVASDVFSYPPEYAVGQYVAVLYEKGNPMRARLRSFWQLWFLPVGLVWQVPLQSG
jgi:hypothetical protein